MRINELFEVSLGDYVRKAKFDKASSQMGAAFAPEPEQRAKAHQRAQRRDKGLSRAGEREMRPRSDAAADHEQKLRDQLPELRQRLEKLERKYDALGGDRWQYADTPMPKDIEAREVADKIRHLRAVIASAQN